MKAVVAVEWEPDGHGKITLILPAQAGLNEEEEERLAEGTHTVMPDLMKAAGLDPAAWVVVDKKGHYKQDPEGNMMAVGIFTIFTPTYASTPEMV